MIHQIDNSVVNGELYFLDGRIFSGVFLNGIFSKGIITFPNGKKYIGEFKNGKPHGRTKVVKNNKVTTEIYCYGIKTNLLYLSKWGNIIGKKIGSLIDINNSVGVNEDEEMLSKKED